jgi:hypothetical protein
VTGAAEGDALTKLRGLNKSPILNLGDGVGLAAGLAVVSIFAFFRGRFGLSDPVGDSVTAGEAVASAGDAVASALLGGRCFFAGESDSAGNSAGTAV